MAGSQRTLRAAVDSAHTIRLSRLPFHEQIELLFFVKVYFGICLGSGARQHHPSVRNGPSNPFVAQTKKGIFCAHSRYMHCSPKRISHVCHHLFVISLATSSIIL